MPNTIPEVDRYIEEAPPFAQPVLTRLRKVFHNAAPDLKEEMKWSTPHFVGNGIVVGMAAFKHHVSFGFWRSKDMADLEGLFGGDPKSSMCTVKAASLKDLPSNKVLGAYVKEAVALDAVVGNVKGRKKRPAKKKAVRRPPLKAPADFMAAMKKTKKALSTFQNFSPSHQREYVEWVTDAKREETRLRRIAQAVEWMAEGKSRHWKYQ